MTIAGSLNPHPAARHRFLQVADSDVRRLFYTTTLLQRFQYNVWPARTGTEVIEMTGVALPALIVTAQFLNDIPGRELIRQLKEDATSRDIPVIVLTDKTDRFDERECLNAGAVTCLAQPVQAEDLYRVIQVAIEPVPRMNIRINTRLAVTVRNRTVECVEGECASVLSEHGVYVRTLDPQPLKTRLPVRVQLGDRTLSAEAEVIYTHDAGDTADDEPGMGLQFVAISPQDQDAIRRFIKKEITKGLN